MIAYLIKISDELPYNRSTGAFNQTNCEPRMDILRIFCQLLGFRKLYLRGWQIIDTGIIRVLKSNIARYNYEMRFLIGFGNTLD